ncbi:GPI ethanolamine phosphate transferase 3 subunit O, partial [Tremellales sp. Uapishka_1]
MSEREKDLAARLSSSRAQIPSSKPSWLSNLSRSSLASLLLVYITSLHLLGLFIFTKGFLLSRVSVPVLTPPYSPSNPALIPATHQRAIILVIDALRTDFISPYHPIPSSPYHHGVLSFPAQMTAAHPSHSLIFNTYSDPPTSTMQRLKGITTGSLPTFIDIGSNFASTAIEEDSIISQLVAANKTLGFMGDDTWSNLFPGAFALNHPYDSFNVEDLHSVDEGVIEHLIPYLQSSNQSRWDVLIGHFLGVDHVGHRVGPYRETMRTKLQQMNNVLKQVVNLMEEDTLLVVLGDHGMDDKGNHGGDSELETAAALWMYSKGAPLSIPAQDKKLLDSWPTYLFPGSKTPIRHVNQIDLVPTLSMMLGLPIPFNNLGSVIPECFAYDTAILDIATRVNAEQIMRYVQEYGDVSILRSLIGGWEKAKAASDLVDSVESSEGDSAPFPVARMSEWLLTGASAPPVKTVQLVQSLHHSITTHRGFSLEALGRLRTLWAQFSFPLIALGLLILGLSIPALVALYVGVRNNGSAWDVYVRLSLETAGMAGGGIGSVIGTVAGAYTREPLVAIKAFLVTAALVSEVVLIAPLVLKLSLPSYRSFQIQRAIGVLVLVAHGVSFASNSFVMWEDRVVLFLIITVPVVHLNKALTAPTPAMRLRIISCSLIFATIVRLASAITVCREEQQPYCRMNFYAASSSSAPTTVLISIIPLAFYLAPVFGAILDISKSNAGPAPFFLRYALKTVLTGNAIYWLLEWAESWEGLQAARIPLVRFLRLWVARASFGITLGALPYLWATSPLCIEIKRETEQTGEEKPVRVYGFANSFGSTYLLFLLIPFALIHLVTLPTGQITLTACLLALLVYLESVDSQRDAVILMNQFNSSSGSIGAFDPSQGTLLVRPSFTDVVPVALLGFVGFFATGHQAVLTSIQWKAAFVGFEVVTYPFSPLLVVLNTWGPFILSGLAIPLLAIWNISPRPQANIPVLGHALQSSLAMMIYHASITLACAVCSAWLRRHLMVWKVFAPRFMLSGITLLIVDLSLIVGLGVGLRITSWKVWRTFKSQSV